MEHPQVRARDMIVELEDDTLPGVSLAGNPIKMDSIPERSGRGPAPEIGEDTASILGLGEESLSRLRHAGVI